MNFAKYKGVIEHLLKLGMIISIVVVCYAFFSRDYYVEKIEKDKDLKPVRVYVVKTKIWGYFNVLMGFLEEIRTEINPIVIDKAKNLVYRPLGEEEATQVRFGFGPIVQIRDLNPETGKVFQTWDMLEGKKHGYFTYFLPDETELVSTFFYNDKPINQTIELKDDLLSNLISNLLEIPTISPKMTQPLLPPLYTGTPVVLKNIKSQSIARKNLHPSFFESLQSVSKKNKKNKILKHGNFDCKLKVFKNEIVLYSKHLILLKGLKPKKFKLPKMSFVYAKHGTVKIVNSQVVEMLFPGQGSTNSIKLKNEKLDGLISLETNHGGLWQCEYKNGLKNGEEKLFLSAKREKPYQIIHWQNNALNGKTILIANKGGSGSSMLNFKANKPDGDQYQVYGKSKGPYTFRWNFSKEKASSAVSEWLAKSSQYVMSPWENPNK